VMDRTNHNRLAEQFSSRLAPDVPATDRIVSRSDNNPSSSLFHAKDALDELKKWLTDNPIVEHQPQLKAGTALKERTLIALNGARTEREGKTKPIREQLNAIFAEYDLVKDKGVLERAYNELRKRLTDYAVAVEAARIAEAERLRKEAEERERLAREAEAAEREAIENAQAGECTDAAGAIEQADAAFTEFRRADKTAAIAEKNVPLRVGSVLGGKSISMRTTEKLVIEDAFAALKVLGLTEDIEEAILKSARAFRKEFNELPTGVRATFVRSM
jgi:hypothetical protein